MEKGLIKFSWDDIDNLDNADISYYLFLEGKSIEAISKIRNIDKEEIKRHVIEGKIKYRFLAKSKNAEELFQTLCNAGKQDKLSVLENLDEKTRESLKAYIRKEYMDMPTKNKESALWIIGEFKDAENLDILTKSIVHKHVNIRRMAASAIGKIGDKAGEFPLIRALDDENSQVVMYAIKALTKIKGERAYSKIKYISENASLDYLRRTAEEYIKSFDIINSGSE